MPQAPNPRDHALVVGIEHYPPPAIRSLPGSANDANLFAQWLGDPNGGGVPSGNITKIISTVAPPPFPPKTHIEDRINDFFVKQTTVTGLLGRRLYLFFSGHGITPPEPNAEDCAIVAPDVNPMGMLRCVPGRLAARTIQRSGMFEEVVLVMDCCREVTGTVDVNLLLPPANAALPAARSYWCGLAAKWSATATERVLPHPLNPAAPPIQQGVFTHALLKGLTAGVDDRGRVTSDSLKKFVRMYVQDLLPPENNQPPEFPYDDSAPPIDFGPGQFTDGVVRLADPAGGFRVLDGVNLKPLAPPLTARQPGEYGIRLPYGMYLFEAPNNGAPPAASQMVKVIAEPFNVQL